MGSHRSPDDYSGDDVRQPEVPAPDPGEHLEHGEEPEQRRSDHFGLFDSHHDADADDLEPATGEFDLTELRDVLAGRGALEQTESVPGDGAADEPPNAAADRFGAKRHSAGKRRHPVRSTLVAILVLVLIAGGVTAGVWWWQQRNVAPQDWTGSSSHTLVVRVYAGDGLYDVGQTLVGAGVVADAQTFATVAVDDGRLAGLQPGFYLVHEHSSAQTAVNDLASPDNRLGQLRIVPGDTLADFVTVSATGEKGTKAGILSKIVDACVPTNGAAQCFTADELWHVAETASSSTLGVVGWASEKVADAPDVQRRLEGLILPGDYDIAPGSTAQAALTAVVSASAARWNTTGIVAAAAKQHRTPYDMTTIASLVQAEGIGPDMRKVARVIYNRLGDGMKLQFDSTVNYGLDRASISTTRSERLDASNSYSTYAHEGLTPTPIGAPGPEALDAAEDPAQGDWLYFVAIDLEGHSCFSTTAEEHDVCVDQARANGVFG